jgi:hypothetical protein
VAVSRPSTNRRIAAVFAASLLALHAADSLAQSPDAPQIFSFSGFGTLGVVHSSEAQADYVANDLQGKGAGHTDSWSAAVDSRLGLQLNADFTSRLSAVAQVLAEQRYDGSFRPGFEWANLRYAVTPDLAIRGGRIVLPAFMTSDTRKIGYAQPWVRPPVELYSLLPVSNSDGVDLTYRMRFGETNHSFKAAYGGTDARIPTGGKVKVRDGWILADTVEHGAATFHVAYSQSKLTIESYQPLFDYYRGVAASATAAAGAVPAFATQYLAAAAQANAIVDRYEPQQLRFFGIGAGYDPGSWFVMGEWGQTDSESIYGKRQAWYTTAGVRLGKFTPYLGFARARLKSPTSDPGMSAFYALPGLAGTAALDAELNERLAVAPNQKTVSAGLRWDFAKSAALKLQYDHSDIYGESAGTLNHTTPAFKPGGRFDVWSATVDFVF